ncbi:MULTISPECIES: hypothetical protein [Bradyrhizobium]|nr:MULTISPECIES: hypothetical protein [Bradyrhizobium]
MPWPMRRIGVLTKGRPAATYATVSRKNEKEGVAVGHRRLAIR